MTFSLDKTIAQEDDPDMALNPTPQSNVEALRREVSRLADVLVHDCAPQAERCWCFGPADIKAYREAKDALARARRIEAEVSAR